MSSGFALEARLVDASARTVAALRAVPCFKELKEADLQKIAAAGTGRWLPRYSKLFREGAAANAFFVLLKGRVARSWLSLDADAMRPSVELYVDERKAEATGVCLGLESLTKRGEFSSAMARNCTVTALEDSFLMQFALEATNSVLEADTSRIFQMFVEREIRSLHLLRGLAARTLHAVVPMFELEELPVAKCSIFEEGDPGDAFYILVSGSVAVQKGDPAITLAILRSGGGRTYAGVDGGCFFGEMALIDGKPRMASVRTLGPVKMLVLRGHHFHDFLDRVPDFRRRLKMIQEVRKNEMSQAMDDADYTRIFAETGTNTLEVEFGATAGVMRGIRSTTSGDFANRYAERHADEIMLKDVRSLMRAPSTGGGGRDRKSSRELNHSP